MTFDLSEQAVRAVLQAVDERESPDVQFAEHLWKRVETRLREGTSSVGGPLADETAWALVAELDALPAESVWPDAGLPGVTKRGAPPNLRRRPMLAAAAAIVLVAVLAVGGVIATHRTRAGDVRVLPPASQGDAPPPELAYVAHAIDLTGVAGCCGSQGLRVALAPGQAWAVSNAGRVFKIDGTTGRVLANVQVGGDESTSWITVASGSVWVPVAGQGIVRIDGSSNSVVGHIPVDIQPGVAGGPPAIGPTALWTVVSNGATVARVDLATLRVTATIAAPPQTGFDHVWRVGSQLWVHLGAPIGSGIVSQQSQIERLDPTTLAVLGTSVLPVSNVSDVTASSSSVWAAGDNGDNREAGLLRLDPADGHILGTFALPATPSAVLGLYVDALTKAADGTLWVAETTVARGVRPGLATLLLHFDTRSAIFVGQISSPERVASIAVSPDGSVWSAGYLGGRIVTYRP